MLGDSRIHALLTSFGSAVSMPRKSIKTKLHKLVLISTAAFMSVASTGLLPFTQLVYAAPSFQLTGTVSKQDGQGLSNVTVSATAPGGSTVEFGPVTTDTAGKYTLPIDTGTYDIHFMPAAGSGYLETVVNNYVVNGNQVLDEQFTPTTHAFSGTLTNSNGVPQAGVNIRLSASPWNGSNAAGSATTDGQGHFSINAAAGKYYLTFSSNNGITSFEFSQTTPDIDLTNGDVTRDLQLKTSVLHVLVKNADGSAASGAYVVSNIAGGATTTLYPGDPGETAGGSLVGIGTTNSSGAIDFVTFTGVTYKASPPAQEYYSICATISGTKTCLAADVTINGDTTVTINQPATHTFSGILTNTAGTPQAGVNLRLSASPWNGDNAAGSATTDSQGHFSIKANPNKYYLTVAGNSQNPSFELSQTAPGIDLTNADLNQNLKLNTAVVHVLVKNADGSAVSGVPVSGIKSSSFTTSMYPGDPGESSGGTLISQGTTDSNGNVDLTSFNGVTYDASPPAAGYNSICATISGAQKCLSSSVTVNGDINVTLSQAVTHTFSGTITNSTGAPQSGATVILSASPWNGDNAAGSAGTDNQGHFSIKAAAGTYYLTVVSTSGNPSFGFSQTTPGINLTNGDVTRDLQLKTAVLHVLVKNADGSAVSGASVISNAANGTTTTLYPGDPGETTGGSLVGIGTTNSSGAVDLVSFIGATYKASPPAQEYNSICATISGTKTCITADVTVSGDMTIVLQKAPLGPSAPSAPTSLNAASPTQKPSLFWLPVSAANSYNVYRDGTKIASTTDPTFVDNNAPEGTRTYHVTAVNAGGESGASNSVSVVVDRTIPEITFTVSPSQHNGWTNGEPVTVTFACTDDRSGVASCTDPVTVPQGDGTYIITGTAVDKAGNTNSINAFVSVDTTKPTVTNAAFAINPRLATDPTATLTAGVADSLSNGSASGIASVEYYDPLQQTWLPMTVNGSTATVTFDTPSDIYTAGTYAFQVRATDAAGNVSTPATASLLIKTPNQAPVINPLAGGTITEGGAYNENGTYSDPESASWTATVDYGDGSGAQNLPLSGTNFALGHVYQDEGTYTVTVSINDNEGATATITTTVTVANAAAAISPITTSGNLVLLGSTLTTSATFTDPGTTDTHTATWDWGDGSAPTTGTITESNGSGSIAGSHTYSAQGVYTITVTLTDNDGAVSTQVFQYVAVYNRGKFAGGDQFNSPIGASIAAPWLSGVATFGISVDNDAQGQVSGTVKMDFDAGNIHLSSNTPTMLVTTADDHATLRGTGTVNSVSGYTYLVTGFDGKVTKTVDTIRFQIKDPNGQVIYDTQMNVLDTDEPSTPLLNPGNGNKADNLVVTYFKN